MSAEFSAVSDMYGAGGIEDPHSLYREYRRTHPVMQGDILSRFGVPSQADYSNLGRPVVTLFKYQDVAAVLRDPVTYSSGLLNEGIGQFLGGFLMTGMDIETHKPIRKMLNPAFGVEAVAGWKSRLAPVAREEIGKLAARQKADLVAEILLPLPVRLIYEVLGYPRDEAKMRQYAARGLKLLIGPQIDPEKARLSIEAAFTAARELYTDTIEVVRQRRAQGSEGNDVIGYMLRANDDGRQLDDAQITELIRQLLPAAAETTTRSFGSMLVALLRRPALLERVRADRTLVSKVIHEGMRWETASQFLARLCERDVEFRGVKIPAGTAVSLATGSANRDEEIYDNPDEFDIDRPMKPNLGFGFGSHICMGMQFAKLEMESMLNALLDLLPGLRLDPSRPPPTIVGAQLRGPRAIFVEWD
jgi:cytochrome P450